MVFNTIRSFFERFWVAFLGCFVAGSVSSFAMAPYNYWFLLLFGFGVLYTALAGAKKNLHGLLYGWAFGFGYFVFGLYWIGNALLVEGNPYIWAWPLAVCGLPFVLAFYIALPGYLCARFLSLEKWHGYLGFVVLITVFEWLRGHLFTGFPWNLFGYTWIDFVEISQLASIGNAYTLSLFTVFCLSVLGFIVVAPSKIARCVIPIVVLFTFGFSYWFGNDRLPHRHEFYSAHVKIVQPNIHQEDKWNRAKIVENFWNVIELSAYNGDVSDASSTIIVWPETTISQAFLDDPGWFHEIVKMLQEYPGDVVLIAGVLRYTPDDDSYHNSIISVRKNGEIDNVYDKHHLVPFGEYIPFQKWIPLDPVVQFKGFKKGDGLAIHETVDDLKYSPLVCYEIIFPGRSIPSDGKPDFIVNVTNDAWYGFSPGPYQHMVQARFRAIEEGVPVIRAANTGFSGIIDPNGRVISKTDLFAKNAILEKIPKKL